MLPWQGDSVRDEAAAVQPRCLISSPAATGDPAAAPPAAPPAAFGKREREAFLPNAQRRISGGNTAFLKRQSRKTNPDKGSARSAAGGRRRHQQRQRGAPRPPPPPAPLRGLRRQDLALPFPWERSPGSPPPRFPRHLQRRERAPARGRRQTMRDPEAGGPGGPVGAVVPCPSPDAVGRRSRGLQELQNPPGSAPGSLAGAIRTFARLRPGERWQGRRRRRRRRLREDGCTRDSSGAVALLSERGVCDAILMQWWDLWLLWWHRNTARSVVSVTIKFAGSGHGRTEHVRVAVPAPRHLF